MTKRRLELIALAAIGVVGLLFGTCAVIVSRINLTDKGAEHVLPLPGNEPLTDAQAQQLARQVLALDGRYTEDFQLQDVTGAIPATQETRTYDSAGFGTLSFHDRKSGWTWYVALKRENGRVIGYSYHGL